MKLIQQMVVVAVLGGILALVLPWWSVAVAGFLGGILLKPGGWSGFAGSFLGIFLLWTGMALWIDLGSDSPLPDRVASLISPGLSGFALAFVSGVVGGLVAGLAGAAGNAFRK